MSAFDCMSNKHLRNLLPDIESTGLPWRAEPGKKHIKLYLRDTLCLVISHGRKSPPNSRTLLNDRAVIRRAAKGLQ